MKVSASSKTGAAVKVGFGDTEKRRAADKPSESAKLDASKSRPHAARADAGGGNAPTVEKSANKPPAPAVMQNPKQDPPTPATAQKSQLRARHIMVLLSFLLLGIVPAVVSGWYLWVRATDQYASYLGFSIRSEEQGSAISSLLGPLNLGGASSTPDGDILYEFIQSQDLVAKIDAKLDLRAIWSKPDSNIDPIFAYHPPGTIENLLDHWGRMVKIAYDSGNGLIELRILAFTPEDARLIAEEIYAESTQMINALSALAREDAIGYARDELEIAVERLKTARRKLTEFRNRTQIVDPSIDVQGQAGILQTLNQQLAEALIESDLLRQTTRSNDPRIAQVERKIQVVEARIDEEKRKLGIGGGGNNADAYATLVGEYESLVVDREFAERTYIAALASFDAAQAQARRQTRYLAAHVRPTLAEKSEYPERVTLLGLITLFSLLIWAILVLLAYSLRDRR